MNIVFAKKGLCDEFEIAKWSQTGKDWKSLVG